MHLICPHSLNSPPRPVKLPTLSATCPTYRQLFRSYPRIRFNGCYISTVNYQRPGATSSSQISWNTPIHIVTYYRYLRFYRDGTCISLLTTHEPVEVVHHLSKENLPGNAAHESSRRYHPQHSNNQPHSEVSSAVAASTIAPPTAKAIMSSSLPGRWHLSPPLRLKSLTLLRPSSILKPSGMIPRNTPTLWHYPSPLPAPTPSPPRQ